MRIPFVDTIMTALSQRQGKTVSGAPANETHSDRTPGGTSLPGITRRDSNVPVTDSIAEQIGLAEDTSHTQPAYRPASYVRNDSRHSQDQERTNSFPTTSPSYSGEDLQTGHEVIQQDGTPTVHPDERAACGAEEGDCPFATAATAREPSASSTNHDEKTKDPIPIVTWTAPERPEDFSDTRIRDPAELRYTRPPVTRK